MKKLIGICLIATMSWTGVQAQEKFEREYRIEDTAVPPAARTLLTNWDLPVKSLKKLKWFAEESQDGKTYEAKFKFRGQRHSVEFSELGELQDVEVHYRWKKLPKSLKSLLKKRLQQTFQSFKVKKVQFQYTGSVEAIKKAVFTGDLAEPLVLKYELVLTAEKDGDTAKYEVLLRRDGSLEKELKFAPVNSDNLEY